MTDTIIVTRKDKIATITLNRPRQLNAFTTSMVDELEKALNPAGHRC